METADKFTRFTESIEGIALPDAFTFPFYYTAHPLSVLAAKQVQTYLENQKEIKHNFGLHEGQDGLIIGKMFGVLVVRNSSDEIGYLAAFSGKLANSNHHAGFVPPVHDILDPNSYFRTEEQVVNDFTTEIQKIEGNADFQTLLIEKNSLWSRANDAIENYKAKVRTSKTKRRLRRKDVSGVEKEILLANHRDKSLFEQFLSREMSVYYDAEKAKISEKIAHFEDKLAKLKNDRKAYSAQLQNRLFNDYSFLDFDGNKKSLQTIFQEELGIRPPAGAGECAAPKLLEYAYKNDMKPLCMAEFWWGDSPPSQVRKHGEFYPSCRSKCEPILGHMMSGLLVEENPMTEELKLSAELSILYEDDYIVAINKPEEFLSVPGKSIATSVLTELQKLYPEATGPLLIHRLDMSTSGILIAAKTKEVHKQIQAQFIARTVKKRYEAVLDGVITEQRGIIELPLRVDLDNRPRQLVCYEHGKAAKTAYKVISVENGRTRVHFFPISGRTHQLRVHAAHKGGLNTAIVGDDLYGRKANRLHLHAASIEFIHPVTERKLIVKSECPF